jgi:radical SAM superfamily enzyme YgiQ (UPF0313 family)
MKDTTILLINPPVHTGENLIPFDPPVGLGYLAQTLELKTISYEVIDMRLGYGIGDLKQKIKECQPMFLGISALTFGYKDTYRLIRRIKRQFPSLKIVVGGPHVSTLQGKSLKDCRDIDFGIVGEGEKSLVELCNSGDEKEIYGIKGLIFRQESEVVYNGPRKVILDLDSLPFPKYAKFELSKYLEKRIPIFTSRGCPHNCIYCPIKTTIGRKYRMRSAESVVNEMDYWYQRGYRQFSILDDNFSAWKGRAYEICDEIEKRGLINLQLSCPNGLRGDKVDRNLLHRMKEVGFTHVAFGVEAGNNKILNTLKKGETIEQIDQAIRDSCDLGYHVDLFFLIGSPGETWRDIEDSFRLASRYPVNARFYSLIPFPGTELYDWVQQNNYFVRQPEDYLNDASQLVNEPCFQTPELSVMERKRAFKHARKMSRKKLIRTLRQTDGFRGILVALFHIIIVRPLRWRVFKISPLLYYSMRRLFLPLIRNVSRARYR